MTAGPKPAVTKTRADNLLCRNGLAESPEKAAAYIISGKVYLGTRRIEKPAELIPSASQIRLKRPEHPFVSRGGVKLEHALNSFAIDCTGKIAMDVGSSTGGFTDCLMARGAKKVFAVDCGTNQLAWKLRSNPAVVCLEKKNFRTLPFGDVGEKADVVTADVSFISLNALTDKFAEFIKPDGDLIVLVKPQFEAAKHHVENGKLNNMALCDDIFTSIQNRFETRFKLVASVNSNLPGKKKKNIEFFIHFKTKHDES